MTPNRINPLFLCRPNLSVVFGLALVWLMAAVPCFLLGHDSEHAACGGCPSHHHEEGPACPDEEPAELPCCSAPEAAPAMIVAATFSGSGTCLAVSGCVAVIDYDGEARNGSRCILRRGTGPPGGVFLTEVFSSLFVGRGPPLRSVS